MDNSTPILTTNNLTVGYRSGGNTAAVLSEINLELHTGELICFMGPNGIGKSTVLRTMVGLQAPISGEVLLNNRPLGSHSAEDLARSISVVLTDSISAGSLTAFDVIKLGRYPYVNWLTQFSDQDHHKVEEAVSLTAVDNLLARKIYELSDGQRQKVMIARALAQDGQVMILDEPNSHLDLNNRVEIMSLLRRLSRETEKAILIATHELDLALQTADKLWLAGGDGEIVQGIAEDLVLTGEFDRIFSMKGFDLKTGKIQIEREQGKEVNLIGEGASFLWTKNALERNGIGVSISEEGLMTVAVSENPLSWSIHKEGNVTECQSIADLLVALS